MRSDVNLAVQLGAMAACVVLRVLTPGWLLIIFFLPICGVLVTHLVLAAVAMPRRRLRIDVALAYGLLTASMLGVAVLVPDGGDGGPWRSPLGLLLGREPEEFTSAALLLSVVWFAALVWVIVGLVVTRPRPVPVSVPYGWPAPVRPAGRM